MNKKQKRTVTIGVILIILLIIFVFRPHNKNDAHKNVDQPKEALAIVIGNHENSPKTSIDKTEENAINEILTTMIKNNDDQDKDAEIEIPIINATKDHDKDSIKINIGGYDATNTYAEQDLKNILDKADAKINKKIAAITPSSSGADYIGAIEMAADSLANSKTKLNIIVIGSGLSDSGVLNFADSDLLSQFPSEIVAELNKNNELSKIKNNENVKIIFQHLGEIESSHGQKKITDEETINKIGDIYTEVLVQMGLSRKNITILQNRYDDDEIKSIKTNGTTVKVTNVPVHETLIEKPVQFSDEQLEFKKDKAILQDNAKAIELLKSVAESANKAKKVNITGYQAFVGDDPKLALQRANAIKAILVKEYDVSSDKISTVGLVEKDQIKVNIAFE